MIAWAYRQLLPHTKENDMTHKLISLLRSITTGVLNSFIGDGNSPGTKSEQAEQQYHETLTDIRYG